MTDGTGDCRIRPMTPADLDAVAAIERRTFQDPWSRDSFERELTVNANVARYLVIERDGRVAGYAGMWLVMDEGHITNIAVDPDMRGMGLGVRLIRALVDEARTLGLVYMTLEVRRSNEKAQRLYRCLGFADVGYRKRYYEDNREDALIMAIEDLQNLK